MSNPNVTRPRQSLVFLVLAAMVVGCGLATVGSGPLTTETRTVPAFDRVEVNNGIAVDIHVGAAPSVQVEAQQDVLPRIVTEVSSGVLKIYHASAFIAAQAPRVTIVMPALNGVTVNGGSQVTADGIAAATFAIDLNGGSALTATGTANTVAVGVNGGSRANLFGLVAQSVVLDINGGSTADVHASVAVTGAANGGSRATVAGGGAITASANGGSSVAHQ